MAPRAPQAREVLELVLAGASLDIDLAVVFEGPGCGFLAEPWARGWQQLVDFDLARLYYRGPGRSSEPPACPAERIGLDFLDQLCAERQVIEL